MQCIFAKKETLSNDNNESNYNYHVDIHWIAFVEYSRMSTHVPGFQSFLRLFASFCTSQISHQKHRV